MKSQLVVQKEKPIELFPFNQTQWRKQNGQLM